MDRQLQLAHLAQAEQHVAEGIAHIERQRSLIRQLERDGHDTTKAKALLETLLETQALHERHFDTIQRELGG